MKYYRNRIDVEVQDQIIDSESLWKLREDNVLVLVDDDQYVITLFDPLLFYQV